MSKTSVCLNNLLDENYIKNEIIDKIPTPRFKLYYDTKGIQIQDKDDLANFITNTDEFNKNFISKKNHKYVYLLYNDNKCVYVGKAIDIKGRLKSHLFKRSDKTNSKIEKVVELLDANQGKLAIEIVVLDIFPAFLYSAVEGILINRYNTTNCWNEKES
ncbi:MAG: GIY-YIG nuclease family protein [Clostridia bacterium]|nr:GIY-YIG nuclease family protein [Clostridia bacterium]